MPKPTLLQTIFNQPSQSYQFPPEKQYYSTKDSLRRAHGYSSHHVISPPNSRPISLASSSFHSLHTVTDIPQQVYTSPSGSVRAASDIFPDSVSVRTSTPAHSSDLSIATSSSSALSQHPPLPPQPNPQLSIPISSYISDPMTSHKAFRFPAPPIPEDDPSDDDHTDIFYTPRSSLYSSPRVSRASSAFSEPKSSSIPPVPKLPPNSLDGIPTPSASRSKSSSTVTSRSSSSSDFGTVISSTTQATTSTRPTSPHNSSDKSTRERSSGQSDIQTIPIHKSHASASSSSSKLNSAKSNSRPHGVPATAGHRRTRSQTENGRFAATDAGWAENVRWLSSNTPAASAQRKAKKLPSQRQVAASGPPPPPVPRRVNGSVVPSPSGSGPGPYPPVAKSAEAREPSTRHSRGSRGSRGRRRMSALLEEEEESGDMSELSISGSSDDSRPPSPPHLERNKTTSTKVTIISTPEPTPTPTPRSTSASPPRRQSWSSNPNGSPRSILNSPSKRNGSVYTAEPEEMLETPTTTTGDPDDDNPDTRLRAYARSSENQRKSYRRLSRSMSLTPTESRAISSSLPTHTLQAPTPASSTPASPINGYTGLTLPRAALPTSNKRKPPDSSGKVDLPRSGVAQSSMATVEIIRGAANVQTAPPPPPSTSVTTSPTANSNSANGGTGGEKRKRKLSFSLKFLGDGSGSNKGSNKLRKSSKESPTPAYLLHDMPLPVAFTARISPPTYVPASHVLIKVFAVGLDPLDSLLVNHKLEVAAGSSGKSSKAVGYIPGRSLVGRVVQCGWDVSSDVCRKSDWVIALLDLRKSGALAEFVVVDRHRIHRAPQPQFQTPPPLTPKRKPLHHRSMSVPINASNPTKSSYTTSLGIEELALLPLCAVPAHRAVRTFNEVLNSRLSRAKREHGRLKAFITNGHDGPGEIAFQILRQKNVAVSIQIPAIYGIYLPGATDKPANGHANGKAPEASAPKVPSREEFELLEARLRAWGADEIHVGDPLQVVQRLVREKESFDLFLDTIGGMEMWESAQRLLLIEPEEIPVPAPTSPSEHPEQETPRPKKQDSKGSVSHAHFCTLVGDHPTRPFPTAQDNIRSGFRSLRRAMSTSRPTTPGIPSSAASSSTSVAAKDVPADGSVGKSKGKRTSKRSVGYSFVNPVADVDYQGEDLTESLSGVLDMVEKGWVRPWTGEDGEDEGNNSGSKVVLFERSPEVFRRNATGPVGPTSSGRNMCRKNSWIAMHTQAVICCTITHHKPWTFRTFSAALLRRRSRHD
ncbi:hypothetical protein QCA50_001113 [Cerrena zonata]|uniref:Uncharacterized protein n=1 Tax=Cerrena zonata TaxID=2478898 RepID=A0AAW0GSE3_9APHY